MKRVATIAHAALLALGASLALGACDAIVGAGDRQLDPSIVCFEGEGCECAPGFGDCDDDPDNGCETDLDDPDHCGACDNVCANGKCESFACACDGTFGECDGDPATVCETDLATASDHCGSCERDCLGGPCEDGLCKPQSVGSVSPVYNFIVEGETIYLAPYDLPGIFEMSASGGMATQIGTDTGFAYGMAKQDEVIYWTTDLDVRKTPLDTGMSVQLAAMTTTWQGMAIGGGYVYWGEIEGTPMSPGNMHLKRVTMMEGGTAEEVMLLGDGKYLHEFVANADGIFWNDVDAILHLLHTATAPFMPDEFLTAPTPPTYFALTSSTLLFAGSVSGTYSAPLTGGAPVKLADEQGYGPLVGDGTNVYFATYVDGDPAPVIWRVPATGGTPVKLAEDSYMSFVRLAVDDQWLYWIGGQQGYIVKIAK